MIDSSSSTNLTNQDNHIIVRFFPDPLSSTYTGEYSVQLSDDGFLDMSRVAQAVGCPSFDITLLQRNGKEFRKWRHHYSMFSLSRIMREDGCIGVSCGSHYRPERLVAGRRTSHRRTKSQRAK